MSRFNAKRSPAPAPKSINKAGGEAFVKSDKLQLVSRLLTAFINNTFYEKATEQLGHIITLTKTISDKKFVAKTAIYARTVFGMRSASHVVAAELAHRIREEHRAAVKGAPVNGAPWYRPFFTKIVYRPDDMVEILSYFLNKYGKPIPNALKAGFSKAFGNFDAYQLGKYRCEGKSLTLRAVAKLVWPTLTEKNQAAIQQLWNDELRSEGTWETMVSEAGKSDNVAAAKKEAWSELILNKRIGQLALLKNLRNISQQAPEVVEAALDLLADEKRMAKSLILPFRFYTAYKEVSGNRQLVEGIEKALDASLCNVPNLPGKTLVAVDGSGSMRGKPWEIGRMFASVLYRANIKADLMVFSSSAKYVTLPSAGIIATMNMMPFPNGGTNFHSIFQLADKKYDRIIILSDGEAWMGYNTADASLVPYERKFGVRPKLFFFDLEGRPNNLQFKEGRCACIPGFSDKVFDMLKLMETDPQALLKEIEAVEL